MRWQGSASNAWGVILAGGDGTRLRSLTEKIEGDARPKQFCRVLGDESLLSQTRRRISSLFDADRTVIVVKKSHESFYAPELREFHEAGLVVQPENRGTGIAIAATILKLIALDPTSVVAFFPCDHHYNDEALFLNAVEAGILTAQDNPDSIILMGAEPTYPETEYGWIEPAHGGSVGSGNAVRVNRFWEKPTLAITEELLRRGCLWNTFVIMGRARTFLDLLCTAAPAAVLGLVTGMGQSDLDSSYRSVPFLDFSRDVLTSQMERLLVIRDASSGWTDLGSPSRVFETLARQKSAPNWLQSIRGVKTAAA